MLKSADFIARVAIATVWFLVAFFVGSLNDPTGWFPPTILMQLPTHDFHILVDLSAISPG